MSPKEWGPGKHYLNMVTPCKWQFPSTYLKSIADMCGRLIFFNAFKPTGGSAQIKISRRKINPRSMSLYVHWKTWNFSKCFCTLNGHNPCTFIVYLVFKAAVPQVSETSLQFKHVGASTEVNGPHSYSESDETCWTGCWMGWRHEK